MNDDFVTEVWEGISMEIARGWHESIMRELTVTMDRSGPCPENPEIWTFEKNACGSRGHVSRCCRANVFKDGDRWICERCRVGTKLVETTGS